MKKLSKLLVLILTLALLVTVFAVVALASDGDGDEPKLTPVTVTGDNFNFEEKETGFEISQTAAKNGIWYVAEADNGNKYAVAAYDKGTGSAGQNWDPTLHNTSKLGIDKYPIMALDFDVRSTTGDFHYGATIRADLYGGPGGHNARLSQTASRKLNNDGFKLSGKDEWKHVTYVIEHAGDGVFNFISYVNGVKTSSISIDYKTTNFSAQYDSNKSIVNYNDLINEDGSMKYSNVRIFCFSIYPPTASTAEQIHFDNMSATYFPAGYTADDAGNYTYNEDYEFPYDYTVAKIGDDVYDDVSEAVAAAEVGETVVLTENADELLVIDKAITVNANGYTFDWESYNGYYLESVDGTLYTFAKAEQTVTVNWDPKCDGNCNCNAVAGGHSLNAQTTVVVGSVPAHPTKDVAFKVTADYRQAKFLGWSYENDGTVDEIIAVGADTTEIALYPVYEIKTYAFEITKTNGTISYHEAAEFKTAVEGISTDATLKLVRDLYIECATINLTKTFTIDLNGYKLERYNASGNVYEATKADDGSFVFGTDNLLSTNAVYNNLFAVKSNGIKLTIKTSVPGAAIYNANMVCDTWIYEGEMVKRTATSFSSGVIVNMHWEDNSNKFKMDIVGGISIYSSALWSQSSASHEGYVFNLENVNFYRIYTTATEIISSRSDMSLVINITNCLFYAPANTKFMYLGTNNNQTAEGIVYIKDSDIIKKDASYSYGIDNRRSKNISIVFDNCRAYDVLDSKSMAIATNGTLQRVADDGGQAVSKLQTAEGYERVTATLKVKYTIPSATAFEADTNTDIQKPTFSTKTTTKTITYDSIVTKAVDVNWIGSNGKVIKTEQLRPGIDAITAPISTFALESDPYKNVLAQWVDAQENGKALGTVLALDSKNNNAINWQEEYNFYAVAELDGVVKYTGGIKDILFNISFNSNFRYNIYLPAEDENLDVQSISDFKKGSAVLVDGKAYYVYTRQIGTTTAAENTEATITFTAKGVAYEQMLNLDALLYADIILESSEVAEEKLAIGNMARFIMEACKVSEVEIDEDRFNAIISATGVQDYKESYKGDGNIATLSDYIYSVNYVIYQGNAHYKFVLKDAAYADLIKFTKDGKVIAFTVEETEIILENAKVYDIIDTLTITVGDKSATYSMLDNIEANPDSDLLKALYEFGLAAENYREYLEQL